MDQGRILSQCLREEATKVGMDDLVSGNSALLGRRGARAVIREECASCVDPVASTASAEASIFSYDMHTFVCYRT